MKQDTSLTIYLNFNLILSYDEVNCISPVHKLFVMYLFLCYNTIRGKLGLIVYKK